MSGDCCFEVGDLVEYKSWYDGDSGWFTINQMIGVVLEIIEIARTETDTSFPKYHALYDVRVYWYTEQMSEIIPDLLLEHFVVNLGENI